MDNVETWLRLEIAELLQLDEVRAEDDFLALGGASLTAIELATRLHERYDIELSLADNFEAPCVAAIADAVRAARPGD